MSYYEEAPPTPRSDLALLEMCVERLGISVDQVRPLPRVEEEGVTFSPEAEAHYTLAVASLQAALAHVKLAHYCAMRGR